MDIRSKAVFGLLIAFAAINSVKWGLNVSGKTYHPLDFRTYYTASGVFLQGDNPYSIKELQLYWLKDTHHPQWTSPPVFPNSTPVYLPQFVWMFGVYNLLGFEIGATLQFALNILSLLLMAICINRLNPKLPVWLCLTGILAFRGTWYALDNGQPMLQAGALILMAITMSVNGNAKVLPGLILGFVSYKFTLLIPVCLFMLLTGRYKILAYTVATSVILNAAVFVIHPEMRHYIVQLPVNMNALWAYTHHGANALSAISTSVSVPIALNGWLPPDTLITAFPILLLLTLTGIAFFIPAQDKGYHLLYISALAGFSFGQHLLYDLLMLLCYRFAVHNPEVKIKTTELALLTCMLLPLGYVADRTGLPGLNNLIPLALLALLCSLFYELLIKYNPAKNAS